MQLLRCSAPPTSRNQPPPPAADACRKSALVQRSAPCWPKHAVYHPPHAPPAEALICCTPGAEALVRTMATSAVRDTVTRPTPGTVVGGMNAVVRLPREWVAERQHTSLSCWRWGGRSAGGGAPNDGEDGKHGYLRGWRGWGRQEHKRGLNKRGCPSGEVALGGFQARSPPPENCTEVDLASESLGVN